MGRGGRGASPLRRRRGPPPRPRRDQQPLRARLRLLRHPRRQPRRRALPHAPRTRSSTAPARPSPRATARVVLQAGEDYGITREWMAGVGAPHQAPRRRPRRSRSSLGERPDEDLAAWREAGADRYLLRFETSDDELYRRIHPDLPGKVSDRMRDPAHAARTGLRGRQRHHGRHPRPDLRERRRRHRALPRDGPGHDRHRAVHRPPARRRWASSSSWRAEIAAEDQVAGRRAHRRTRSSPSRAWRCPDANIPSTTALATINKAGGREHGLQRGANVVMPNLTPPEYRVSATRSTRTRRAVHETAEAINESIQRLLSSLGRTAGAGAGGRRD